MIAKFTLIKGSIKQFQGIILFAIVLTISNLIWKYNVIGDESMSIFSKVTLWGLDISSPFYHMAIHIAKAVQSLLNLLGWQISLDSSNTIRHLNGNGTQIIWACTGLKQAYIFICILLFYK